MKLIATDLDGTIVRHDGTVSPRTVEAHRARVMEKMGVRSLAELVQCALESSQAQR